MLVYIRTKSDWNNFYNGTIVEMLLDKPEKFFKQIFISPIEIEYQDNLTVKVMKRY